MPISKVEMSLDDIIKVNKKKEQTLKSQDKRKFPAKKTGVKRQNGGVAKRRAQAPQKKVGGNRVARPVNRQVARKGKLVPRKTPNAAVPNAATKKLVQKLVKKALAQTSVRNVRATPVVRNVVRRGGVRAIKGIPVINRINQRSRVIARRVPIAAPVVVRGRGQIRYETVAPIVVRAPRRNFVRPVLTQVRRARQQQFVPQNNSIRGQISALRQQQQPRQRTVYVQQPQRQQQRVVYVQQQPRRQNRQTGPQGRQQNFRKARQGQNRAQSNSATFFDPPNFLQRIPAAAVQEGARRRVVSYY